MSKGVASLQATVTQLIDSRVSTHLNVHSSSQSIVINQAYPDLDLVHVLWGSRKVS